jgi:hypothetical protein
MKNWWDINIHPLVLLVIGVLVFCLALLFSLSGCTYSHSVAWSAFEPSPEEIKDEERFLKNAWIIILPGAKDEEK